MDIQQFSVRLTTPLETARGRLRERAGFLVTVKYDGATGIGEATPLPGWTESHDECRAALDRAATIADELDWGIALSKLDAPAARHGVSLALADARAKAESQPLYRSLGGTEHVSTVPVNATIGTDASDPDEVASLAVEAVDEGFKCLKLKVGANGIEDDVERVRAVRNAVGDGVEIRADANGAWTPEEAERAFGHLAALGVSYVEQPLPTAELSACERLQDSPVGVALDESLAAHDVSHVIERGVADVLVLKPMVIGGPDRVVEAVGRCRAAGVESVVTSTIDAVVARTGAVHVAATIPDVAACGLATADRLATDLGPDPAPVSDGQVPVPQEPGIGIPDSPI